MIKCLDNKPKLKAVLKWLLPLASDWRNIGVLLDIEDPKLENIKRDEVGVQNCLRAMLSEWIKMVDPQPNWKNLVEALESSHPNEARQIKEWLAT